jgi:hypothetical protein
MRHACPVEVEKYTRNRCTTATIDYRGGGYPSGANGHDSDGSGLGDVKLVARLRIFARQELRPPVGPQAAHRQADPQAMADDGSQVAVDPGLQLNGHYAASDTGEAADIFSTGGTLVCFTPGEMVPVGR